MARNRLEGGARPGGGFCALPSKRKDESLSICHQPIGRLRMGLSMLVYPHAPHPGEGDDEPIYPGTCRRLAESSNPAPDKPYAWRFKVPEGGKLLFDDGCRGLQQFKGGVHFGDFVVWQKDGRPSYQLAVVVDDAAMRITEVVRGEDLLKSAARQLLIYKALDLPVPSFFHCPLVKDDHGVRLAKRHDALSLRSLKQKLGSPTSLIDSWQRFW